ncbi:2-oxoglutarate dehydrogenase E1 component [Myxococcota bacterium]|nr:2-oxoglutarate dehydrogenase E1 component [Myxococcota bacterium]
MTPDSLLFGDNAAYLDDLYLQWLENPTSVEPRFAALFASFERPAKPPRPAAPDTRSIFNPGAAPTPAPALASAAAAVDPRTLLLAQATPRLINAFRVRGHMLADIDPLARLERHEHAELTPAWYGLTEADFGREVDTTPLMGVPPRAPLGVVLKRLHKSYCGSIGAEIMNIPALDQRLWLQERLETLPDRVTLPKATAMRALRKLNDAEGFERALHNRFPGTKRFSLEGAESLIPLLDTLVEDSGAQGVTEVVLGMAHRGRLNVLSNILDKPLGAIAKEFEDNSPKTFQGSGDVKYHLGYSSERVTAAGPVVTLSLAFNPSHLEAVNPVVEGRVRARHDRLGGGKAAIKQVLPVLLHGDAAFAGQGLVAETLNLSDLAGYRTGGTIHVVINNQIGFTTPPHEARSTPYATDVARMLAVPIFHVNGEDLDALIATVKLAVEWRQTFHRDVVIDMYCFRKHGHNEGDEPSFTQPLEYEAIRSHPSAGKVFARALVETGRASQAEVDGVFGESREELERQIGHQPEIGRDSYTGNSKSPMGAIWSKYRLGLDAPADTTFPLEELKALLVQANTLPEGFNAHPKILRLLQQRLEIARGERPVDWAVAEQAAYGTLAVQGQRVRLSGQDSGRGTFSHRHALLTDVKTGAERFPLDHLREGQARFQVMDSMLSEAAVLGFEYGYTLDYPDALVLWEAQFGDFVNGAQVIIDQFIVAGEQKWNRCSGLVMLLPHGYEGQGPEHSSAKMERFLMLCAEDNMQLANCTTPASLFHILRRQALRPSRKPLVIFTPKSLLRHPECISTLEELANGSFQAVIPEVEALSAPSVRRLVLCQGKVYYDLLAERRKRGVDDVALVRIEELYPYPRAAIQAEVDRYPAAEVVWCQEEPRNMGAWPVYCDWLREQLPSHRQPVYVGRKPAASPATGSHHIHAEELRALLDAALRPA